MFDLKENDTYWCTADIGWVTGHSYITYGPLANGATSVMYEGAPNYPREDRFWSLIAKHRVSIFYTAPTAIRAFYQLAAHLTAKAPICRARAMLGSVGEPINPEARMWYQAHYRRRLLFHYRYLQADRAQHDRRPRLAAEAGALTGSNSTTGLEVLPAFVAGSGRLKRVGLLPTNVGGFPAACRTGRPWSGRSLATMSRCMSAVLELKAGRSTTADAALARMRDG